MPVDSTPEDTKELSISLSHRRHWAPPVSRYIDECLARQGRLAPQQLKHALGREHVGRRVPHPVPRRHLHDPWGLRDPDRHGKLRLAYESNPMAFIVEQAGGEASDGTKRILGIVPTWLHQRASVAPGSKNEVQRLLDYHRAA
jgi:fructose-1,6-bisphosphatase I